MSHTKLKYLIHLLYSKVTNPPTAVKSRLNSANKSRRRLLQRESKSPEYIKHNEQHAAAEVFHTPRSIDLRKELRYEDEEGDVTPRVCQLDSVRELDEDKEIRDITDK